MPHVIVWDMETVPDLKGFAAANENRRRADISDRGGVEPPSRRVLQDMKCVKCVVASYPVDTLWVRDHDVRHPQ